MLHKLYELSYKTSYLKKGNLGVEFIRTPGNFQDVEGCQGLKFKIFSTIQWDTRNTKCDICHENLASHIYIYNNAQTLNWTKSVGGGGARGAQAVKIMLPNITICIV